MGCGLANDLKEFGHEAKAAIGSVEKSVGIVGDLNLTLSEYQAAEKSSCHFRHTSFSHSTVAFNARAASPTTLSTLNTYPEDEFLSQEITKG